MAILLIPEARADLRDALRYYRAINPPALGKRLAARLFEAFTAAIRGVEDMPFSRPEHPDIAGARFVLLRDFPYLAFYTVKGADVVIVSVEYATRDYVARVSERIAAAK